MASISEQLAAIKNTVGPKKEGPMLSFGQYKGRHISEVPDSYLQYLSKRNIDNPDITEMLHDEIERRELILC